MDWLVAAAVFGIADGTKSQAPSYLCRLFSPGNLPNIGLVVVAIGGIVVAIRTLNHMRESSERQLQAYVLPDKSSIVDGTMLTPPQPAKMNVPGVTMLIRNFGQTPAYKVISWAQIAVIAVENENTMLVVPPLQKRFSNTVGPGGTNNKALWFDRPLAANEITDIAAGVRGIYLYGKIEYQDAFNRLRFTNFRLRYTGPFPPHPEAIFWFSENGNDSN